MAATTRAPIIVLHQGDDAVDVFHTKDEAVKQLSEKDANDSGALVKSDFFDSGGRRLAPDTDLNGLLFDFTVASAEKHSEEVRKRVRRRAQHVRRIVEQDEEGFRDQDRSALTLADEDITFFVFARRLAEVLDPTPRQESVNVDHNRSFLHNLFRH